MKQHFNGISTALKLALITALLAGCRATQKVVTLNTTDSVVLERTIVDTVVRVLADTATARALLECDSLGNVLMAELACSQGQRVSMTPEVRYIVKTDSSTGRKYRVAYLSTMAVADSLQVRVNALTERLSHVQNRHMAKRKERGAPLAHVFLFGLAAGVALALYLVARHKL